MTKQVSWSQRGVAGFTAAALVVSQLALPPRAEASHLGSTIASAGSAPPPAATLIESFQPDLFTGRATTSIPIVVPPGRKGLPGHRALLAPSGLRVPRVIRRPRGLQAHLLPGRNSWSW